MKRLTLDQINPSTNIDDDGGRSRTEDAAPRLLCPLPGAPIDGQPWILPGWFDVCGVVGASHGMVGEGGRIIWWGV
jgi:hypothetical protein